jgi:membrane protease YdiL (CAAX protease family)
MDRTGNKETWLSAIVAGAARANAVSRRVARESAMSGVGLFFLAVVVSQVLLGARMRSAWWAGAVYAAANILFGSVVLALVARFARPDRMAPGDPGVGARSAPLALVLVVVALHDAALFHQFPYRAVSTNRLTVMVGSVLWPAFGTVERALHGTGLSDPFAGDLAGSVVGLGEMVLLPALLLAPWWRRRAARGFDDLPFRLFAWIALLYAPLFVAVGRHSATPRGALLYFLGAALPEEFLYRVMLQGHLQPFFKDRLVPIALAATMFGLMHLPINTRMYGWPSSVVACLGMNAFGGFLFGCIYQRTRSWALVTAVHFVAGMAVGGR